jgi:hypothetical protein
VQEQPLEPLPGHDGIVGRSIALVSGYRVANGCCMHPDLVRASRSQVHLSEHRVWKSFQGHKMRDGFLALRIDPHVTFSTATLVRK